MLRKKVNKILSVLVAVIIAFSCFSFNTYAASNETIFSSSDIVSLISSEEFTQVSSVPAYISSAIVLPAYRFSVPDSSSDLKVDFNFDFSSVDISRYKSYNIHLPLVFGLVSSSISFSNVSIIFKILYNDGSVSMFIAKPDIYENVSTSSRALYDVLFDFTITGEKLLNIADCYFEIDCSSSAQSSCYLGISNSDSFTLSNFSPSYNTFFSSSVGWTSKILGLVTGSAALMILCLGFPIVLFSFLLLKRLFSN